MINIKTLLFLATAVSARAVYRRTTAQILADLQSIDSSTRSLTSTVQTWDGSVLGSLSINSAANNLGNQIDAANTDAKGQPVASSSDSQEIISYISGTLEPDIEASLTALEAKKSEFVADGEESLVESTLTSLQNKTNSYSTTLVGIASSDQKANAQAVASKINSDFAAAITDFSS